MTKKVNNIKESLMQQARFKGICLDGYSQMRCDDIDALVDYYVENPDWCMERDFPTLDFLAEHFSDVSDKGVFVNRKFKGELLNDRQVYIFHNCRGNVKVGLNVDKAIIPMLYCANGCRMRFVGTGDFVPKRGSQRTHIPVYSFGENDISARSNKFVEFNRFKSDLI